jgi:adenylylsulfate kinase-like enzyme
MDYFRVLNDTEGEREAFIFDGDELSHALIKFLDLMRHDRKVSLTHVGEEYEEE